MHGEVVLASGGSAGGVGGVGGYSVGWLTLSLINAGLAQGKGRSGLNWWLLSLLLGPLATLFVVVRPRLDTPSVRLLMEVAAAEAGAHEDPADPAGLADR